jgi:hypothetical protein
MVVMMHFMIVDERMEHLFTDLLLLGRAFFCMARCETLFSTYTFSFLSKLSVFSRPLDLMIQKGPKIYVFPRSNCPGGRKRGGGVLPPLPHSFPPSSGLSETMKLITEDSFSLVPS